LRMPLIAQFRIFGVGWAEMHVAVADDVEGWHAVKHTGP
jgi:hypothetical protein